MVPGVTFAIFLLNGDGFAGFLVIFTFKSKYILNAVFACVIKL